jgi:hypothetical protein
VTQALHVERMRVRYRLETGDPDARRRLDALLRRTLDEAVEPALARAGVRTDEEVCIRSVRAPARLRLGAGDSAICATWAASIADAVARTVDAGGSGEVVRYASRRHALLDLALGVAAGELERAWAWRRLGLWHGPTDAPTDAEAADELVRALTGEPELAVAALVAVGQAGTLGRLLSLLDAVSWVELVRAALAASGVAEPAARIALEAPVSPSHPDALADASSPAAARVAERARRIAIRSELVRALGRLAPLDLSRERALALALLATLEAEPAALRAGAAAVAERAQLVAAVVEQLSAFAEGAAPAAAARAEDRTASASGDTAADSDDEPRHTTRHGGLLFLLAVLDELGLPDELASDPALAGRPLRWTLHRLASGLAPVEPDDPAALAFAGLPPTARPPSDEGLPPADEELEAVAARVPRIVERVRERLAADEPDDDVLAFVCRRSGEILGDPGWIELRLPLREVSVELRRAALDLDPGWLPWLGAVVRFVYA